MSNKRLFDRSAYSNTTLSTYELLASYIVDVYYNHLYVEAIKMKNASTNSVASITEGYKHAVLAFLSAIDNKSKTYKAKHYAQLLTGINQYFTTWTSFSTLTLSDCINKIVVEFIPSDYFDSLNKDQLRNILRVVLTNSIREFSKVVIVDHLTQIIDNHKEPANIQALKECLVDILIMEREGFYRKFLSTSAGKKTETVDKDLAIKMQREIKRIQKEYTALTKENTKLKKEKETRDRQMMQVLHKYKLLVSKYKGLVAQNQRLQETMREPSEYEYEEPDVQHYQPPDLFDPHTVHFHGFPQSSTVFDGLPESGVSINMGATLTYYYNLVEPGTFMYHCHVEATEHMQMGMLGTLYVRPAQNGTPLGVCAGGAPCTKFAYNDGDGSTGYDVEYPIQLGSFDPDFHDASWFVQPLPFAMMWDRYPMINGRGYPDTVDPNPLPAPAENGGIASQVESSLITATQGQRILLRLSNLNITDVHTLSSPSIPMEVVGIDAKQLVSTTGEPLYYTTNSVTMGGGMSADVILDTTGVAPGDYYLYAANLQYLANFDEAQPTGGMMTKIVVQ